MPFFIIGFLIVYISMTDTVFSHSKVIFSLVFKKNPSVNCHLYQKAIILIKMPISEIHMT